MVLLSWEVCHRRSYSLRRHYDCVLSFAHEVCNLVIWIVLTGPQLSCRLLCFVKKYREQLQVWQLKSTAVGCQTP
jgi:hypothetical protein